MENITVLYEIEKQKKAERFIKLHFTFRNDKTRCFIADNLYQASFADNGERRAPDVILDELCMTIFGASFYEVVDAFDNYLG